MEPYIEHAPPGHWSESRFGDGAASLPDIDAASSGYFQLPREQESNPYRMRTSRLYQENALMHSALLQQPFAQDVHGTIRGGDNSISPAILQKPDVLQNSEMESLQASYPTVHSSPLQSLPSFRRNNVGSRSSSAQANAPQPSPSWCQSYINKPRSDLTSMAAGSSGEGAHHHEDEGNRAAENIRFHGSSRNAQCRPPQLMQSDAHQLQQQIPGGQPMFIPLLGTHTGVAQPQGAAAVVAGTARPRVRARRGQATDPHSIAERLRRERIAERMKALQELVPNANKTDKASMLDEIIDYVKFLQLQVKVLSMSRLGGVGALAPLIADMPGEGETSLTAALNSFGFQDGMAVAERQVARLMEEDMGSAMQFLQAKGLCLMPISLASIISNEDSRMMMGTGNGGGRQHGLHNIDQSWLHAASSTSSTLASVASSGCVGGEGDSKSK